MHPNQPVAKQLVSLQNNLFPYKTCFLTKLVSSQNNSFPYPHGNHCRKVERGDASRDSERLTIADRVHAAGNVMKRFSENQRRYTATVLDHLCDGEKNN